jgi:hypothetical protein
MNQICTAAVRKSKSNAGNLTEQTILWVLFVLICFGLGYPTLNRYDPRTVGGTSDSSAYYELVTRGPAAVEGKMRFRLLVPYVARPFLLASPGTSQNLESCILWTFGRKIPCSQPPRLGC